MGRQITTWILSPTASGTATDVRLSTIWEGSGGVGGFFERTFAPGGCAASTASCSTA